MHLEIKNTTVNNLIEGVFQLNGLDVEASL